jgi:Recombination endonuclease VII
MMIGKSYKVCTESGCDRNWIARGLCTKHYAFRKRYDTLPPLVAINKGRECSVEDCTNEALARGICPTHWARLKAGHADWDTRPVVKKRKMNYGGDWRSKEKKGMVNWEYKLHRTYGLQKGEYEQLLQEQGGGCAICGEECPSGRRLAVDHDHTTGVVRGLLCIHCNQAIGKLADCPDRMINALIYLIRYRAMANIT